MMRLTTDAPKNNLESALNLFYAKDGEAWVLRGGSEPAYADGTLFDYIRAAILNVLGPKTPILNLSDEERKIVVDLKKYGISGKFKATDLWSKEEKENIEGELKAVIAPHAPLIVRLIERI